MTKSGSSNVAKQTAQLLHFNLLDFRKAWLRPLQRRHGDCNFRSTATPFMVNEAMPDCKLQGSLTKSSHWQGGSFWTARQCHEDMSALQAACLIQKIQEAWSVTCHLSKCICQKQVALHLEVFSFSYWTKLQWQTHAFSFSRNRGQPT